MRGVSAAALGGALLLGLTGCGPLDKPPKPSLSAPGLFYVRPTGDKSGPQDKEPYHVRVGNDTGAGARRLTVDVLPGSEHAVRLRRQGHCSGDTLHVTCDVDSSYNNWVNGERVLPVAAEGSRPGDTGTVRVTYTTKDGKELSARTRVVVGEPVVEVRTAAPLEDVRPGAEITAPVVVHNAGEVPVVGLGLEIGSGTQEFTQRYSNCRYPETRHGHTAVCRFPRLRIAPGETVVLRPALRMRASSAYMYGYFTQEAWALDMGPGQYGSYPKGGDPGDGPALRAEVTRDGHGRFAQRIVSTHVRLDTRADYELSDVTVHGDPGDERGVRLTVHNEGPGDPGLSARLVFEPPPGSGVVKQPMAQVDDGYFEPYCAEKDFTYICDVGELAPGKSRTFDFTLHLGEPGTGRIALRSIVVPDGGRTDRRDPDPTDDSALVTVAP